MPLYWWFVYKTHFQWSKYAYCNRTNNLPISFNVLSGMSVISGDPSSSSIYNIVLSISNTTYYMKAYRDGNADSNIVGNGYFIGYK